MLRKSSSVAKSLRRLGSTVSEAEVAGFSRLASQWWDPKGPMQTLHSMNAVRVPWVAEGVGGELAGMRVLDVGCGAGLLSEPLARLGAKVKGLDASEDCVRAAEAHREESGDPGLGSLTYVQGNVEELVCQEAASYEAVVASEVLEHVGDRRLFLESCAELVAPGGSLFVTTINRTMAARLLAIAVAEDVLRLVPKGTHQWSMFVPPEELETQLRSVGLETRSLQGLLYVPGLDRWLWTSNTSVNYALHAVKPKD